MEGSREDNWRDVTENGKDKKNIHKLRWDVYTREKKELIKREFSVYVTYPKGGDIFWTCVKDNIIKEMYQYKAIILRMFDYKLFEEGEYGVIQEGLDGYPYLKHLINLWPGYWFNQMTKMNESVFGKNCLDKSGEKKWLVSPFKRQEFWKRIGCIISEVTVMRKIEITTYLM